MTSADLLVDAFGRVRGVVRRVVTGLTPEQLSERVRGPGPGPRANSIAWLIWHLTRIQDDHVADAADVEQVWTSAGWVGRFGLPFEPRATGFGQTDAEVSAVTVKSGELLIGYHEAVYEQTISYVRGLRDDDLSRIVDESWDPPVSLGARLISVIADDLQHGGQAAIIRGLVAG